MRYVQAGVVRAVLAGVAAFSCVAAASACLCPGVPILDRATADRSYAVFDGVVIHKRVVLRKEYGFYVPVNAYAFRATRIWKGDESREIELQQVANDCGRDFSPGERYLVFADRYRNRLWASGCSPTQWLTDRYPRRDAAEVLGAPRATFNSGKSGDVPGPVAERWYFLRGYAVAGVCAIANIASHPSEVNDLYLPPASLWAAAAGCGVTLVLLGIALFGLRHRAIRTAGFVLAATMLATTLVAVGVLSKPGRVRWDAPDPLPPPPPPASEAAGG